LDLNGWIGTEVRAWRSLAIRTFSIEGTAADVFHLGFGRFSMEGRAADVFHVAIRTFSIGAEVAVSSRSVDEVYELRERWKMR